MTLQRWILTASIVLIGLAGWGALRYHAKDPKVLRLEQAKIALSAGRTSQAIDFARLVLADDPKNILAMRIQAEAERKSKDFDACETTLRAMLAIEPDSVENRQRLSTCLLLKLDDLLAVRDFSKNTALQTKFDETLRAGLAEAAWFKDHDTSGEYAFLLGRFYMVDSYRLERMGTARGQIDRRLDQALESLNQAVEKNPDNSAAGYLMAKILFDRGNFEQASRILGPLSVREPESLQVRLLYAEVLIKENRLHDAEDELEYVQKSAPRNARVLSLMVKLCKQKNDREQLVKIIKQLESFGDNPDYQISLAEGLLHLNLNDPTNRPRIKNILETLDRQRYDPPRVNLLRGQYYIQGERYILAAEILEELVRRNPNDSEAMRLYGQALWNLGRRDGITGSKSNKTLNEQAFDLQTTLRQRPDDPQVYRQLGQLYRDHHQVKQGISIFHALTSFNDGLAKTEEARLLYQSGKVQQAETILKTIFPKLLDRKAPSAITAADLWAEICIHQNRLQDAFAIYDRMIEADVMPLEAELRRYDLSPSPTRLSDLTKRIQPNEPTLMYEVLMRLERTDRTEEALTLLDRWIKARPEQGVLQRWRGNLLARVGRSNEAIDAYRKALTLNPEDVESWEKIAAIYLSRQDFCKVETIFKEMMNIDEGLARRGQACLAEMYASIGLDRLAEEMIAMLEKQPIIRDPKVLLDGGEACLRLGQRERAVEKFIGPLEQDSSARSAGEKLLANYSKTTQRNVSVSAAYLEAQKLILANQTDEAIKAMRAIYAQPGPCQESAGNDLAYLLARFKADQIEEAWTIARTLYDHQYRSPQLLETLGWIEHLRGNNTEALALLNRSILLMPSQPEIRRHLAQVYESLGNARWANYYRQAKEGMR